MSRKGRIVIKTLFVVVFLSLPVGQIQAQLQPVNSQTDFYYAHITDGGLVAGNGWTTQFRLINPNPFNVIGTLQFFATDGVPLEVDFGTGLFSLFTVSISANGSLRFETLGSSPELKTGFAKGSFNFPIQATSEFRNWRNGIFANGASVDGITPAQAFLTYADEFTGIAVANPNSTSVSCQGIFRDTHGSIIRQTTVLLAGLNQKSFTLGNFLSLPSNSIGSFKLDCSLPIVSLAIAGNERGITSSLPSGALRAAEAPPQGGSPCSPAIESLISGTFEGWDGDTIFPLTNGQIWEQAEYSYTYHYAYRPDVIIYPSVVGCKMQVEGVRDTIRVRRIQ